MQFRLSIGTRCREHFRGGGWVVGNNPLENMPFDLQVPSPSLHRRFLRKILNGKRQLLAWLCQSSSAAFGRFMPVAKG